LKPISLRKEKTYLRGFLEGVRETAGPCFSLPVLTHPLKALISPTIYGTAEAVPFVPEFVGSVEIHFPSP
jgi:hypothetical protein